MKVQRPLGGAPRAPDDHTDIRLNELVYLDVEYSSHNDELSIPPEHLSHFLKEFRKNLELAVALENEIGGYGLQTFNPIEAEPAEEPAYLHGISKPIASFAKLFRQLTDVDPKLAKAEAIAWQSNQDPIFARLAIWATADERLFTASEAARIIRKIKRDEFWNVRDQRDLLIVLAKRWSGLSISARRGLERRLLQGRGKWTGEKTDEFRSRRASQILDRLFWLSSRGCNFSFNLQKEATRLRLDAPQWDSSFAEHAADSLESRTGWVRTDTDSSALTNEPLANVLTKAQELSGRTREFFVERDPFSGFAEKRPVRAFASLVVATKRGIVSDWAWRTFLNSESRKADKPRLVIAIAIRLSNIITPTSVALVRPASDWIQRVSKSLVPIRRDVFDRLWAALVTALKSQVEAGASSIIRQREDPDWATEALNSPVGSLAQALMNDPILSGRQPLTKFPDWWTVHVEELLLLPGPLRRHALPLLAHNLGWLFAIDPTWTEQNFLRFSERNDEDSSAFWAGFFWGAKIPQQELYLLLKPSFLRLASGRTIDRRQHTEILAGVILAGWGSRMTASGDRIITDEELRTTLITSDDEFRTNVVWQLERWSQEPESRWNEEALTLLRQVWPRQIAAKTARVSARLCDLAFSQEERFPDYVDAILPLVTRIVGDDVNLPILRRAKDNIVDLFPENALAILSEVLPDNVRRWPYGIDSILSRISSSDPALLLDSRLIELNRKWNSR